MATPKPEAGSLDPETSFPALIDRLLRREDSDDR